jgi:signal transduction histidine kinase
VIRPSFGIRARTTLSATVVVGVALILASVSLVLFMRHALRTSIEAAAATRASDVALLARSGSLPPSLPGRGEALLVQVVAAGDRVIASSPSIEGDAPFSLGALPAGHSRTFTLDALPAEKVNAADADSEPATPFLVIAHGVQTSKGPVTVLVAASLSPLEDTSDALVPLLSGGVPVVLLVLAATVWALTGLALRPVASIRAEAEAISSSELDRRLPVPAAHDEIRDLSETMNRMLDRLETASVLQRRFTANASHELKSPIASIRTMLEVARHNPEHADLPSLFDDLLAEDLRLELLVADLLILGQSDEGALKLSLSAFDLGAVAEEEVRAVTAPNGRRIDTSGITDVMVTADSARLRQVLRNLLDNAIRHAVSTVWVSTRADGSTAVLTVSDDGRGIPADARERVFDRFVRLDDNRSRIEGGTGLGLAVCRAIVAAHRGTIVVVEPEHGGATFEVRLPV